MKRILLIICTLAALALPVQAAIPFRVTISGDFNVPTITVYNDAPLWKGANAQITRFTMTVGDVTRNFDFVDSLAHPSGGLVTLERPDTVNEGVIADMLILNISGFDPGESFRFRTDLDADGNFYSGEDFRRVLFNNGAQANAEITVTSGSQSETIVLPDGPADLSSYTFGSATQTRLLTVTSVAEAGGSEYVSRATVKINGAIGVDINNQPTTQIGQTVKIQVADGDTVEVSAPQEVYKNIHGQDITDSVANDPTVIQNEGEERFTAIGISVNNIAETADPTLYTFEIDRATDVIVKWRHDYALTVRQSFADTIAYDGSSIWAGPLSSEAEGNPFPPAKKSWFKKGDTVIAQIDGQVVKFERPGLDIRYVPKGYRAYGPPNIQMSDQQVATLRKTVDIRGTNLYTTNFVVGQSPPQRQQVRQFTMSNPGGITYLWQIQFGVNVNVDDPTRSGLPRLLQKTSNAQWVEVGNTEGVFWFDPGAALRIGAPAHVTDQNSTALNGWFNGDGFYFSPVGTIDTIAGKLLEGGPAIRDGSPVAQWKTNFTHNAKEYRGLEISQLRRPVKVLWRYGPPAIALDATLGEYVFQHHTNYARIFTNPPDQIIRLTLQNPNIPVGDSDMAIWDPVAAKLFPLVPGEFKALWRPDPALSNTVNVFVTAKYPPSPHYPHLIGTPPVALDPDPADDFTFKQIRYTENNASVDGDKHFTVNTKGKTVLLFGHLQRQGRGLPREFLAVRVVDTRDYQTPALTTRDAIIGRKIEDPDLDRAKLGTGFATSLAAIEGAGGGALAPARPPFNHFIYDANKLTGLAAKDIYYPGTNVVAHPENLPGPIIPVNLLPNADRERILVVWYADPATHDRLLWPHAARYYRPVWPTTNEGLARIVIASQFGSESLDLTGAEQIVADGLTNLLRDPSGAVTATNTLPAETTYNPARLQQVQIYHQPHPNLPGYNPNEEHALIAPSLRFAEVSPRPPAIYALRHNDLNRYNPASATELNQGTDYTSHPFVLVQFFDTAAGEFKMRVYEVKRELGTRYQFAATNKLLPTTPSRDLLAEPHLTMEAGEPVIPFYPLGVVIGASPCAATLGTNVKAQTVYWEDHKGSAWAVSGGTDAWFTVSFHYPLAPDFWWPPGKPGLMSASGLATVPQAGDCVSFLPAAIAPFLALTADLAVPPAIQTSNRPTRILYHSDWPAVAPVLKAGETLTFSGGEFRADNPTMLIAGADGEPQTIQTPGLPGVLAFATAQVVFDSLNPLAQATLWRQSWTARIAQVLEQRAVSLPINNFPQSLAPATGRTRVKQGKYVFNELPASLQKRFRYHPLTGQLELLGLLNDKDIGEPTLTASPPAVYVLEPNILTPEEALALKDLDPSPPWQNAIDQLFALTRNPANLQNSPAGYLVGLEPAIKRDANGKPLVPLQRDAASPAPFHAFGPGLALIPNAGFLDPTGIIPGASGTPPVPYPEISWVTVAENNDPTLGGSPITLHVIKVDRRHRYRGAIKTVLSDNVFDENIVLRHTGDFGANADLLFFEWWYRPDDGSLNVPPPDFFAPGAPGGSPLGPGVPNPWKLFPDPTGRRGQARFQITLKGNPNTPEVLLADTWWFCRYRHTNDSVSGTDWNVPQPPPPGGTSQHPAPRVNFTWAGAGNSDPFNDFDLDGLPDYRAQLAQGWIKRVLDAVNPYEARIRDFNGDNPITKASMLAQFGARFEGPVALNPAKDVIENVGLIELYETILKRARDFSIDLSRPVSTPAIANALQLASTRIADFYTILGNEAYVDAQDPSIGFGSESVEYGSLAPATFAFQNQISSLLEEELALLRGVDDFFARPVYNRLFWNFTKAEGEPAYALNYDLTDINHDGFIDEHDAIILYPQGHGDAWGHYLAAIRHQYDLLKHPFFNWVSRSEFYNLQDIVINVDFLDERKFAQIAAAKAKTAAEIVNMTYREKYVEDSAAQWQGYTDSNKDRAWGVQEWARRTAQSAYFDWVTANALLPSVHPNENLEGVQKVDREANSDIAVISANLNAIQNTFDQANRGENPLGLSSDIVPFDLDPTFLDIASGLQGSQHFEQIYERALKALENAVAIWDVANEMRNKLSRVANSELEFRNAVFQEDLSYRNQLIKLFGKPYAGTIGPGKLYPPGYDGPDLLLYMYVDVRQINDNTVPGPTTTFATFDPTGAVTAGDIYEAFQNGQGKGPAGLVTVVGGNTDRDHQTLAQLTTVEDPIRRLFAPTFATSAGVTPILARNGLYALNYTDLLTPKVPLQNLAQLMPVTAAGYTFQAPGGWGARPAVGELQLLINQMLQQEAQIASAIGAWDALQGAIVRELRVINAKLDLIANVRGDTESLMRWKTWITEILKGIEGALEIHEAAQETIQHFTLAVTELIPDTLPTVGLAVSPGDAAGAGDAAAAITGAASTAGISASTAALKLFKLGVEGAFAIGEMNHNLSVKREEDGQTAKELLKELENLVGDEPIKRIEIFKEIQALREMGDRYRALLDEGTRLIDERAAYNKRVAAQTQRSRYQDMTFRVSRNHALQTYRSAFDLAARYAYMAVKTYDYEINFDPANAGAPTDLYGDIIRARHLGEFDGMDGEPRLGKGGLGEILVKLKANYDHLRTQLGFNNPQLESGKISLRTELFRIQPNGTSPTADTLWRNTLQKARVADLWLEPEFRYYCRPFASHVDGSGNHVAEPGLVIRFPTQIMAGRNLFGKPLSGADHAYDPSHFVTKVRSVGVWFSDYLSEDILNDLPATPRVYFVPAGADVMSVPTSDNPSVVRVWKVLDQRIPVPFPALTSQLDNANWIPLLDSLNGQLGEPRKYAAFRAYHDGSDVVDLDELVTDTRLIGRSVWNTQWVLIIPGRMLNADPNVGLDRFIQQVTDIKMVFQTYGFAGN